MPSCKLSQQWAQHVPPIGNRKMVEAVIDLVPSVMHSGRAKESRENDYLFSSYQVSVLNFKATSA